MQEKKEQERPKISHVFPKEDWAFRYIMRNLEREIPEMEHVEDLLGRKGDVKHVYSPNCFKYAKADSKTVLHLDGNRWFENFLTEEK